jgi:hypothetical protein
MRLGRWSKPSIGCALPAFAAVRRFRPLLAFAAQFSLKFGVETTRIRPVRAKLHDTARRATCVSPREKGIAMRGKPLCGPRSS